MIVDLRSGSEINTGSETLANIRMHISALNSLLIALEAVPVTGSCCTKPRLLNYSQRSTVEPLVSCRVLTMLSIMQLITFKAKSSELVGIYGALACRAVHLHNYQAPGIQNKALQFIFEIILHV